MRALKITALWLSLVFACGAVIGGLAFGWSLAFGDPLPNWRWRHFIVVAFLVGLIAAALQLVFLPVERVLIDADRTTHPLWQRGLRAVGLVVIGLALVVTSVLLRQQGIL